MNDPAIHNPDGRQLALHFNVISNEFDNEDRFYAELILSNKSSQTLHRNWSIYFNFVRKIFPETVPKEFIVTHINGDFFSLSPTKEFKCLKPKEKVRIDFIANFWAIKKNDAPKGFYIVYRDEDGEELQPQNIESLSIGDFLNNEQNMISSKDKLDVSTPEARFYEAENLPLLSKNSLSPITPKPQMLAMNDKVYTIRPNTKISYQSLLKKEAYHLLNFFKKQFHLELDLTDKDDGDIQLFHKINGEQSDRNSPEAYELKIDEDGICIIGNDLPGTFYGIQSLVQLVLLDKNSSSEKIQVPFCQISDFPQFTYRGIHLDVARNFHNTETIKSLLDYLALYKLNKFHFHLTDDEGWRLEIRGLPELTKIGGRRGHDLSETKCLLPSLGSGFDHSDLLSSGNGYYSRNEFKELIQYANDRHIEVIPAIDLPGHARAAIRAMEVRYDRFIADGNPGKAKEFLLTEWADESDYESVQMWRRNVVNIGLSSTYRFIEKVVDEIIALYSEADVKLTTIHIGGDEVPEGSWSKSPECNNLIQESSELENTHDLTAYFLKRVNVILTSRGLNTAGWEEIVLCHNEDKVKPNEQLADLNLTAYTWNTMWGSGNEEFPYKLANMGYKIVLSNAPTLYFDMAYCKDPEEPGYYWAGYSETEDVFKFIPLNFYRSAKKDALGNIIHPETRYHKAEVLNEKGKENILGLQGQLWSENINSKERLEYQLFPRLCALAERGWSNTSELDTLIDKGWNEFSNRLGQIDLPRLDRLFSNINYRIPMPGVRIENDILKANVTLPGLTIRYTTDGSEPHENSEIYLAPIIINTPVIKLKTFATNNNYSRTTIIKTPVNEVKKLVS